MLKKRLSVSQKLIVSLVLALVFSLNAFFGIGGNFLKRMENKTIDHRFLIRADLGMGPESGEGVLPIVIVLIDNESALKFGYRSPTPRKLLARLIGELDKKGARVIGIDVLLDDSYHNDEDEVLEKAIAEAGNKVVLVDDFRGKGSGEKKEILKRFSRHANVGFSISKSEEDDYHRWVNMYPNRDQEPFSAVLYRVFAGKPARLPDKLGLSGENPWALLDFTGPPSRADGETANNFTVISAGELEYFGDDYFKGKIVLVGSGIEDLGDVFLMPFSLKSNDYRAIFGVELQAIAVSMLLRNAFLYPLAKSWEFVLTFAIFFSAGAAFLFFRPAWALVLLPAAVAVWFAISATGFVWYRTVCPTVLPVGGLTVIFIVCQWIIQITEQKHSRFIKNMFQHYISPALVDQLVENRTEVSLGGKKEELTILFSDLKGFTSISEKLAPEAMIELLHIYFDEMTRILLKENGTLDKYIGDAVMAFFGAPTPVPTHAANACRTALAMKRKLDELNSNPCENWLPMDARIGINTGEVIVGNSGSKTRFNYTVMGDNVNLASRLEGVNNLFGSRILASESTIESIAETDRAALAEFLIRELGKVVVKGKIRPVAVFELMAFTELATDKLHELKGQYETALADFYSGNFEKAKNLFSGLRDGHEDPASEFMLEQIRYLMQKPPYDSWKGEIVLLSKS